MALCTVSSQSLTLPDCPPGGITPREMAVVGLVTSEAAPCAAAPSRRCSLQEAYLTTTTNHRRRHRNRRSARWGGSIRPETFLLSAKNATGERRTVAPAVTPSPTRSRQLWPHVESVTGTYSALRVRHLGGFWIARLG